MARATGAPDDLVLAEAARALAAFSHDPQGLVTACRRMVSRQPTSAGMVWLCARVLTAGDPVEEIRAALDDLEGDRTPVELAHALPEEATVVVLGWPDAVASALARRGDLEVLVVDVLSEGSGLFRRMVAADLDAVDVPVAGLGAAVAEADLVLLEAEVVAPDEFLAVSGSRAAAAVARHAERPVWLVAGTGRLLPRRMWEPVRGPARPRRAMGRRRRGGAARPGRPIAGPRGPEPVVDALRRTDCPVAPELFKGDVI